MDLHEATGKIMEHIKNGNFIILQHAQNKIDLRQINDFHNILKTKEFIGIRKQICDGEERYELAFPYENNGDLKVVIKINSDNMEIITTFEEKRGKR